MPHRAASQRLTPSSAPPEPVSLWPAALTLGMAVAIALAAALAAAGRSLSPFTWYVTRASGITLYLLLWLVTLLGLGLTTTLLNRLGGRATLYSVHRYATELAYGFLALHAITLAVDQTVPFRPVALVVPFASPWREPWTGFGLLGAQLTVVIGVSLGLRRWIGQRGWRALHVLAFPAYAMALAHGIGAGSDTGALWMRLVYAVTGLSILWLTTYRLLRGRGRARPAWAKERAASFAERAAIIR